MKKVVITGCNGYIGKKLAEYLLKQNKEVIGLDIGDGSSLTEYKKFKYIKFGLNDENIEIVRAFQPSVLYHFAWCGVSTIDKNDPSKQFKNLEITYNMLELARLAGIKKVIVPGSVSEFSGSNKPITGYEPDSPSDLYAATKVAVRKLAFYYYLILKKMPRVVRYLL